MVARLQSESVEEGQRPRGDSGLRRVQCDEPRELRGLCGRHEFALLWKSRRDAAGATIATIGEAEVLTGVQSSHVAIASIGSRLCGNSSAFPGACRRGP